MIKIILADNQAVFRAGAARVLAHESDIKVMGECTELPRLKELVGSVQHPLVMVPTSFTADLIGLLEWLHGEGGRAIVILEHGVTLPDSKPRKEDGFVTR